MDLQMQPALSKNSSDLDLLAAAQAGNADATALLVLRYSSLVRFFASAVFCAGMETDDLIQEGMIGLIGAIRTFDFNQSASFKTYVSVCIRSKISTATTRLQCGKHLPLNSYLPFHQVFDEQVYWISLTARTALFDPANFIVQKENDLDMERQLSALLSSFEKDSFLLYLSGYSYDEIALKLSASSKAINNALQRVRRKLRLAWDSRAAVYHFINR